MLLATLTGSQCGRFRGRVSPLHPVNLLSGIFTLWKEADFPPSPLVIHQLPDKHLKTHPTDLTLKAGSKQLREVGQNAPETEMWQA